MDMTIDIDNWDITLDGADIASDAGLRSAVLVSLFTDRRAEEDDAVEGDHRGCWSDILEPVAGDRIGSRLWLLDRAKETAATLRDAKRYAEEALQWLVDDGHATGVTVTAWPERPGLLALRVVITLPDGSEFSDVFEV